MSNCSVMSSGSSRPSRLTHRRGWWVFRIGLAAACAMLAGAHARAQTLEPRLQAASPTDLLPPEKSAGFEFRDSVNSAAAPGSFLLVGAEDGRPVFRAHTPKGGRNQYGVSSSWRSARGVKPGDVILVRFAARAIEARQETGEAEGLFYFQGVGGGESDVTHSFSVGPDWTVVNVPFVAKNSYPEGQARMAIAFANLPQTIEFKSLQAWNFENRVKLTELPVTRFSYAGREPDAAWRKAAFERISALRTTPLIFRVVDGRNRPVAGARVEASMTRSAFLWGTAVSAERLVERSAEGDRYRKEFLRNFDAAVFDNGLKWPRWRNPDARRRTLQALDWLESRNVPVKGHNLAWTAWKFSPDDIAKDPDRCAKIGPLVDAHIREMTGALKGRLIGWDVVNEPVHETDYWKCIPRETVATWFKLAAASDPKLKLTLNEYGMLNRSSSPLMIAEFLDFSRMLRKNGARVDVLGVQGHVGQTPRPPEAVLTDLDLLAVDGQEIQITEFDFNTQDEALQADYTRDFLIALYSHKAVTGLLQWGFWESAHWKPAAAMFARDWRKKPNGKVWEDLVRGEWRTHVDARTGADGLVRSTAHFGTYDIVATANGRTVKMPGVAIGRGKGEILIRLDGRSPGSTGSAGRAPATKNAHGSEGTR